MKHNLVVWSHCCCLRRSEGKLYGVVTNEQKHFTALTRGTGTTSFPQEGMSWTFFVQSSSSSAAPAAAVPEFIFEACDPVNTRTTKSF